MNRIHEIFHTFDFSHPKGSGGSQGIMKSPPSNLIKKDALELSNTDFYLLKNSYVKYNTS